MRSFFLWTLETRDKILIVNNEIPLGISSIKWSEWTTPTALNFIQSGVGI